MPDPYLWLEDGDDPRVRDWVAQQTSLTRAHLDRRAGREALRRRFRELHYYDFSSPPLRYGTRWFFSRRQADGEKWIYCYRDSPEGAEHVALDPSALSADGSLSVRETWPSQTGRYLAYKVSKNAQDAGTLRIRDLESGEDLAGAVWDSGFDVSDAVWSPRDEGLYYVSRPADPSLPLARRAEQSELSFHALGTPAAADRTLLGARLGTIALGASASGDGRWLIVQWSSVQSGGVWVKDLWEPDASSLHPDSIDRFYRVGLMQLLERKALSYSVDAWAGHFYVHTNEGAPRGRVFRVAEGRLARAHWEEIVPQHATATLREVSIAGGRLVLNWIEDVQERLEVRTLQGESLYGIDLPGIGATTGFYGRPGDDTGYYAFHSFTAPARVFSVRLATGESRPWRDVGLPVDLSRVVTRQVFFESKDGTRIPMFLVHDRELSQDGDRPTLLTGYGGFGISQTPYFSPRNAVWLEHGGVLAVPNLRGGGEYGRTWHSAGARENKQNTFDDFAAAARWLIAQNITRPGRLAIWGGSNGGLLVGAAMTQNPELFRAVICAVPLLDMLRYHHFASHYAEYGSADDPAFFSILRSYSPYHRVRKGTEYPALLLMSADSDDRVHPMHARKFLAAIQWASAGSSPALLRVERNAGHTGSDLVAKAVEANVDQMVFLFSQLGMAVSAQ